MTVCGDQEETLKNGKGDMKYLFLMLFLVGCGEGYHVKQVHISNRCVTETVTKYTCEHQKPIFHYNSQIAICDTKEECFKICEQHRGNVAQ